jgi:hypothetical protein
LLVDYYEEKDWPSFPDDLLSQLVAWGATAERAVPSQKKHPFSMLQVPRGLRDWVEQNIPVEIDENWIVTMQRFDSMWSPFHIDTLRDWSYNCVIDGESAITHFKDRIDGDVVQSVKYQKNKWYFHNGSKPHGVTDIPRRRVAVTMYKIKPDKLRPAERVAGTAPQLAEMWKADPYFYYV